MTRLHTAFARLYHCPNDGDGLVDAQGRVRTLVVGLSGPSEWAPLASLWAAVQADWGWPAPAIVASGADAMQLWFSLGEPLPMAEAHAALEALRQHYLADIARRRVQLWPAPDATTPPAPVPALHEASGQWSAFLAPDLAPLFADTPWLDMQPGDEGQANLLSHLSSISPAMLAAAMASLAPADAVPTPTPALASTHPGAHTAPALTGHADPAQFLLAVMNDAATPMALRIEAAKALLAHARTPVPAAPR